MYEMTSKSPVSSKILLNGLKKDLPQVKIIEPFSPEIIECETKEDFNEILNADPDKYKDMTTQKLNKTFKIPGYKITKIKGEICLRSIKPCEQLRCPELAHERHDNHNLDVINEEIKNIKLAFNQLSEQFELIKKYIMKEEEN